MLTLGSRRRTDGMPSTCVQSREAMRRASFHEHECASYKELADAYAAEAKSLREWAQRKPGQAQNTAAESGGESEVAGAQSKEVGLLRAKVERLSQEVGAAVLRPCLCGALKWPLCADVHPTRCLRSSAWSSRRRRTPPAPPTAGWWGTCRSR